MCSLWHGGFRVAVLLMWQLRLHKHMPMEKGQAEASSPLWPSLGSHRAFLLPHAVHQGSHNKSTDSSSVDTQIYWMVCFLSLVSQIQSNTDLFSYSFEGQKFEIGFTGPKSRCWQGCLPKKSPGENPFLCLFQLQEAAVIPWFMASSLIFKDSSLASSTLSLTVTLCFYHYIVYF